MQQHTPESGRHAPLRACSRCGHGHAHWAEPDDGTEKLPSRVAGGPCSGILDMGGVELGPKWSGFNMVEASTAWDFFWGMGM